MSHSHSLYDPLRSTSVFELIRLVQRLAYSGRCVTHGLRFCLCDSEVQSCCLLSSCYPQISLSRDGTQMILYSVYAFLFGVDSHLVTCPDFIPYEGTIQALARFLELRFSLTLPLGIEESQSLLDQPCPSFELEQEQVASVSPRRSKGSRLRANRAARKKMGLVDNVVMTDCPNIVTSDHMEVEIPTFTGGSSPTPVEPGSGIYAWSPV